MAVAREAALDFGGRQYNVGDQALANCDEWLRRWETGATEMIRLILFLAATHFTFWNVGTLRTVRRLES